MKPSDCLELNLGTRMAGEGGMLKAHVTVRFKSAEHLWIYAHLLGAYTPGLKLPGHEPPVAWRQGDWEGFPVVVSPAVGDQGVCRLQPAEAADWPVLLDGEPGRRP